MGKKGKEAKICRGPWRRSCTDCVMLMLILCLGRLPPVGAGDGDPFYVQYCIRPRLHQHQHQLCLRGGSAELCPEYEKIIRGRQVSNAQPIGSVEQTDISDQLPWPEGSEEKRRSFTEYQVQYKAARRDFEGHLQNVRAIEQQQRVHKITIKALDSVNTTRDSCVYTPHGRMFLAVDRDQLKETLEYQTEKVLEEALCEVVDVKSTSEQSMRTLERNMQDVLNNVFKGRFQLFLEGNSKT